MKKTSHKLIIKKNGIFFLILVTLLANTATAENKITATNFNNNEWLKSDQELHFTLKTETEIPAQSLAFFIGKRDISSFVKAASNTEFHYASALWPLPSGEQELIVYQRSDNQQQTEWQELARLPLNVLTHSGFESAAFTPYISLNASGSDNSADYDGNKESFSSRLLDSQISLESSHQRKNLNITSQWNFIGSSEQESALRFSELGYDAPKLDLSDYLIQIKKGNIQLDLGQVSYGENPLLIEGISNRGAVLHYQNEKNIQIKLGLQNGRSIVGYDNLLGIEEYQNNHLGNLGLSYTLKGQQAGFLRFDLDYLQAKTSAESDFGTGAVNEAEENSGNSLSFTGSNEAGTLRGQLIHANSRYLTPPDPNLANDPFAATFSANSDSAQLLSLEYDILQANSEAEHPINLALQLTHNRTGSLYRSIAASPSADLESNSLALVGSWGELNAQLQLQRSFDNLRRIPTLLSMLQKNSALALSYPLQSLLTENNPWVPQNVDYSYQQGQQLAEDPGGTFDPTDLPNFVSEAHNLAFSWQVDQIGISYSYGLSLQDNRQLLQQQADSQDTSQSLDIDYPILDNLSSSFSLAHTESEDKEIRFSRYADSFGLTLQWQISDNWAFASSLSGSQESDSDNNSVIDDQSIELQLSYQFSVPSPWRAMPGNAFLRYAQNQNRNQDTLYDSTSSSKTIAINAGLSLEF